MRNLSVVRFSVSLLFIGALTGCGPVHLVEELSYKSDVDKMVVQVRASQQQCKDEMQTSALDPIRQKVELARDLGDKDPPPFAIASNQSVPTDTELPVVAKWASMRDVCVKRVNALRVIPSSASNNEKLTFPQQMGIKTDYSARVGELVVLLYRQKLTYGELAQKQYDFAREAMSAELALTQGIVARDDDRQALALQQFATVEKGWADYIQTVDARKPKVN
jgi:hypothetical protein